MNTPKEDHAWRGCNARVGLDGRCNEVSAGGEGRCDKHSRRCAGIVAKTGEQCRLRRGYGSKYCKSHHRKLVG